MFTQIEAAVSRAFKQQLASKLNLNREVTLEQPKQSSFGELAIPVAFQLARELKRPPKQIAEELIAGLPKPEGVACFEIAGNGYINLRLDRGAYAWSILRGVETKPEQSLDKIIVEHTNINPNKAAHIGHLRNAVLGDTFVRMLRKRSYRVEVQNYIDNTGVQVADVVAGFHYLGHKSIDDVKALIESASPRFDYHCWDLYARISAHYKEHPESLAWRDATLHAIESGESDLVVLGHIVSDAIVSAHLKTMCRLGIKYDVLPRESEILHLKFWATALELLKQRNAIYFETQGKNKGCWVMPAAAFRTADAESERGEAEGEDSKVIVRSNGTVTYVGKDIAYQLWKFGLLGKDFYYRPGFSYPDGHQVWVTDDKPYATAPSFGAAAQVFNVIDSRQAYLQDVVVAGLRALGFTREADASVHFSYEMVMLSPRTCAELGIELSDEDKRRPYVEVSGRKGLGVKADDLIDKLIETALEEVESRHPDAPVEQRRQVATQIAAGALRYFMLKFTRNSLIAFDLHEALGFEGETGPYVQYAAVRAQNILRKFKERSGVLPDFERSLSPESLARCFDSEELWQLLLLASKADSIVDRAIGSGEPAHVAKYGFQLAQAFNNFYHHSPVLGEEDMERRNTLLWLTQYVHQQLLRTMDVLGIEQPEYM
ncbi:MAG: arginine--tRNA ligase [Acidobacteriaceae bacterium]|nr:arginine--tRNA ligase [Acidobacteriaceae bacterium]MBV9781077.1 arginine--tRNA ligase [Acidobacteriaceae bacterium]